MMEVRIKMKGGELRTAKVSDVHYNEDYAVISGPFFCPELGYSTYMNIREIHIVDVEYIK